MKIMYALLILTSAHVYAADAEKVLIQKIIKGSPASRKSSTKKVGDVWDETFTYYKIGGSSIPTQDGIKLFFEQTVYYLKDSANETHPRIRVFFYADGETTRVASDTFYGEERGTIDGIYPAKNVPDSVKKRQAERQALFLAHIRAQEREERENG